MTANVRYWRSVERDALKALDAATDRTSLNMAAQQLMRARRQLAALAAEQAKVTPT